MSTCHTVRFELAIPNVGADRGGRELEVVSNLVHRQKVRGGVCGAHALRWSLLGRLWWRLAWGHYTRVAERLFVAATDQAGRDEEDGGKNKVNTSL